MRKKEVGQRTALVLWAVPPLRGVGSGGEMTESLGERTYTVPAIHCEGCANTITEVLEPLEGVEAATVDLGSKTVRVSEERS
jgi:hypothetical protein